MTLLKTFCAASDGTFTDTMYAGSSWKALCSISAGDICGTGRTVDEHAAVSSATTVIGIHSQHRCTNLDMGPLSFLNSGFRSKF